MFNKTFRKKVPKKTRNVRKVNFCDKINRRVECCVLVREERRKGIGRGVVYALLKSLPIIDWFV